MKKILIYQIIYVVLFSLLRHVDPNGIVFYQGIMVGLILSAVIFYNSAGDKRYEDALLVFFISYAINITIVTTVDRAYSVKMISWIGESQNGLKISNLEYLFEERFIKTGGVVKRTTEQTKSGLIKVDEKGNYILTDFGDFVNRTFMVVHNVFVLR